MDDLKNSVINSETKFSELKEEHTRLKEEHTELQKQLSLYAKASTDKETRLKSIISTLTKLAEESSRQTKNDAVKLKEQLKDATDVRLKVESQMKTVEKELACANSQIKQLKARYSQKSSESWTVESYLRSTITTLKEDLKRKNKLHEQSLASLKSESELSSSSDSIVEDFRPTRRSVTKPSPPFVSLNSTVLKCQARPNLPTRIQNGWLFGTVSSIQNGSALYCVTLSTTTLAPSCRDLQVPEHTLIGVHSLPKLVKGDKLAFELSKPRQHNRCAGPMRPFVYRASILSYCGPRTLASLLLYFGSTTTRADETATRSETMNAVMMSDALWFYLFNVHCDCPATHNQYLKVFFRFVFHLSSYMETFPSKRKEIYSTILSRGLISQIKDDAERRPIEIKFFECVLTSDPTFLNGVTPLLSEMVKNTSSAEAKMLFKILLKVSSIVDVSDWKTLTPVPTMEELFGDPLERVPFLKPVKLNLNYSSAEEYLDIYYRLLRTECFSAIQKGIVDLKKGELESRDMSVYYHVSVVDISIQYSRVIVFLRFTPDKPVPSWSRSKKLMFGNLLCITVKGDFSDPIWMSVVDRDDDRLQRYSVIGVEFVSFNNDTDVAKSVTSLIYNADRMIMVESPTYFQSFRYILDSLKNSDIKNFRLFNEIVYGKTVVDTKLSYTLVSSFFCRNILNNVGYSQLEDSQKVAFDHAVNCTVAVIQGPPGTGKTFVGVKLAQLYYLLQQEGRIKEFLSKDNGNTSCSKPDNKFSKDADHEPPILVLTYKNHALDEFLKRCLAFCDKSDLTRIGSRSKEEELEDCLIRKKMEESRIRKESSWGIVTDINRLFGEFQQHLDKLEATSAFNFEGFMERVSSEQIISFVNHALQLPSKLSISWRKRKSVPYQVLLKCFEEWTQTQTFHDDYIATVRTCAKPSNRKGGEEKKDENETGNEDKAEEDPTDPDNLTEENRESINGNISEDDIDVEDTMLEEDWSLDEDKLKAEVIRKVKQCFEEHWIPDKEKLKGFAMLQQRGSTFFNEAPPILNFDEDEIEQDAINNIDDVDEDYINELHALRTSAFGADQLVDKEAVKNANLEKIIKSRMKKASTPHEFCISDFPLNCAQNKALMNHTDFWSLGDIEKYTYIYTFLFYGYDDIIEAMNQILEKISIQQQNKKVIDVRNKVRVLRTQKIVGATIVGASVQLSMIQKLAPKIVIVEEAAEVLESCLVGVLTRSVQKLILIGDHMQLKPHINTYYLRKEYDFHISMMERLIGVGMPYKTLVRQGRMLPEFSCMLKDIYPDYKDFDGLAEKNTPIECIPYSMFFWSHSFPEDRDRSVKNAQEANMVVALAMFFMASGVAEEDITILCAYMGQLQLVRQLFRELNPREDKASVADKSKIKKFVNIRTIDEYQGDENKFVIISLTRSNSKQIIGFLKEQERRCVAQSRAKCGLYFVGNASMFRYHPTWKPVLDEMTKHCLVREKLPICCYQHKDKVHHVVQASDLMTDLKDGIPVAQPQLSYFIKNTSSWCNVPCRTLFGCRIESHRCKKLCTPRHDHVQCLVKVSFSFPDCGHQTVKRCYVQNEDMRCRVPESHELGCGHTKLTTCNEWRNNCKKLICTEPCKKSYRCSEMHKCEYVCGKEHTHSSKDCPIQVEFVITGCGHTAYFRKVCGKPTPENVKCKQRLTYTSKDCGHVQRLECHQKELCQHPCSKTRSDCGHPCENKCHESCLSGACEVCEIEYRGALKKAREAASYQMELHKKEAEESVSKFSLLLLSEDLQELSHVTQKCQVFFQLYTQCEITIKNIHKVICPDNSAKYWECVTKANGSLQEELFKIVPSKVDPIKINSLANAMNIIVNTKDCPLFELYKYATPDDYKDCHLDNVTLFISDVLVGDTINVSITYNSPQAVRKCLRERKKDSMMMSKPGAPARYRVFNENQVHLKYVVQFSLHKRKSGDMDALKAMDDGEHKVELSKFNLRDVSNPLCDLVQRAVSLYTGDRCKRHAYTQSRQPLKEIKQVGIVINHNVAQSYDEKKEKCEKDGQEFEEVFAYHATAVANVQSIIKMNLDPNRGVVHGRVYGDGCYFSEHPNFSFNYGQDCMFIFKLLLVRDEYTKVQPDKSGFCQQLVLKDSSMFKPVFVLYF